MRSKHMQQVSLESGTKSKAEKEAKVNASGGATSVEQERMLITAAKSGDRAALRRLIDLHKDRLFSFIWRMVRNHHDAEDICQDAFLRAFSSLDTFSKEFRFSTWLFTIGYRVCLNRLRKKRAVSGDVDFAAMGLTDDREVVGPLQSEEAGQLRDQVWGAVDQLSSPQRAAILLFYRFEMGCQEIARVLELPIATVKSHLHRGRLRLRELLEPLQEEVLQSYRNQAG